MKRQQENHEETAIALSREAAIIAAISDERQKEQASAVLTDLNRKLDAIAAEKERVTKPLNEALKAERSRWKPAEDALNAAIAHVRGKLSAYQTEQKRIADEAAAKVAARVGDGKGKLRVETAARKMGEIERPAAKVALDGGASVGFKEVKYFEVVDKSKLPMTLLKPDEVAIRNHMNAGIEVEGVRYWTQMDPINRRK